MSVKSPIQDFLLQHAKGDPISFHMPGHKGSKLYREMGYGEFVDRFIDCDITEIVGADNLFQTEGIIKEAQERYAALYEVKKSYLQVNGSSGAIIASMLTTIPKGGKVIMARNCHKSAFNALTLGNMTPVYAYPEIIEEYNITGAISPEEIDRLLKENPDASAVILPSPNYYGICSDIEAIAEVVHRYDKPLIVDQAHGAHLKFFRKYGIKGMPKSAEDCGADIIINSIHKTLASLTGSALLNVNSDRVDLQVLEDKLQAVETTSPSYILMATLDINTSMIFEHGEELFHRWAEGLNYFYDEMPKIPGMKHMNRIKGLDWTKMNFSMKNFGIMGDELEDLLMKRYGIFIELFTGDLVVCMTGIGNRPEEMKRLVDALKDLAEERKERLSTTKPVAVDDIIKVPTGTLELCEIPENKKKIKLTDAEGKICASSIIPYPPGIPYICPGEKLTGEAINYIKALRSKGEKVIGVSSEGNILVGA